MVIIKKFLVLMLLFKLTTLQAMHSFAGGEIEPCDGGCLAWFFAVPSCCVPEPVKSGVLGMYSIIGKNIENICHTLSSSFFKNENDENKTLKPFSNEEQWQPSSTLEVKTYYINFSDSGSKIITCTPSIIALWDRKSGQQLASFDLATEPNYDDEGENIKLSKDETKLFVVSRFGERSCFDIKNKCLLWQGAKIPNISSITVVTNKYRDVSNVGTTTVFSDDESKFLVRSWNKTVLINAFTGNVELVLWDIDDNNNNNTIVADFYRNSARVIVLHNGCLNNHTSNELVDYVAMVPYQARCPLYNKEKNMLVCFDDESCKTINLNTKDEQILPLSRRRGSQATTIQLINSGNKVLFSCNGGRIDGDFGDFYNIVDIYDLPSNSLQATIKSHSAPDIIRFFNSHTQTLLLGLKDQVELWDITNESIVWSLKNSKPWCDYAVINEKGDEIIINEQQQQLVIWKKS
jgi:hypothetical protein